MDKIEIAPQTQNKKISLADNDFALYQTLKELIEALNNLARRLK